MELRLASDEKSIDECRGIYRKIMGRSPRRFPMPAWIFRRFGFAGRDLSTMWRWLRTGIREVDLETVYSIHPGARDVESWLHRQKELQAQERGQSGAPIDDAP